MSRRICKWLGAGERRAWKGGRGEWTGEQKQRPERTPRAGQRDQAPSRTSEGQTGVCPSPDPRGFDGRWAPAGSLGCGPRLRPRASGPSLLAATAPPGLTGSLTLAQGGPPSPVCW